MQPKTLASESYYRQRALESIGRKKFDYYNALADKAAAQERKLAHEQAEADYHEAAADPSASDTTLDRIHGANRASGQWCRECGIAARCTHVTVYGPLSAERARSDYVCRDCGRTWEDDTPIDRSPPSCLAGPTVRSVLGGAA